MLVLVLVGLALTVVIGMVRGSGAGAEIVAPSPSAVSEGASIESAVLYVHVAGAVDAPGLYSLPGGARVVDAVAAAGGLSDGADASAINLARVVSDGEQILVPLIGQAPPVSGAGVGTGGSGPVDLNTADLDALDALPRIGPALAERILAWRSENGRFTSVEDLLAVPGIGEKMLEGLRDLVRV